MSEPAGLDLDRLENARLRGGKLIARCPACAAEGADRSGEHLVIFDGGAGRWGCIACAGDDLDAKAHRRRIAELVGRESPRRAPPPVVRREAPKPRDLVLPELRFPTVGELDRIAQVRGLPTSAGLELAARAGQLRTATLRDAGEAVDAWIVTDSARRCAQARRLDGQPWRGIGAKAWTLAGSRASWPIGAADIGDKPHVALCEGAPDFLAAWTLLFWHERTRDLAPVFLAGSHAIAADALPLFAGNRVFLVPHRDPAGERARTVWTRQLREAGAEWVQPLDVSPHKDLNELLAAEAAQLDADAY